MSKTSQIALMSAQIFAATDNGSDAPEWVHLLPASDGVGIETGDSRGPYHVIDPAQVIAASFAINEKLPIDENHSIDLAAKHGSPSPAKGWIVEMQARADGIWGRVEWNAAGKDLMASHAYRGLSPVITHNEDKVVGAILRASLVNQPNLRGLTALNNMESDMALEELLAKLAKALGLKEGANEGAVISAIAALKKGGDKPALQSQMTAIGVALGVEGSDGAAILTAAKAADQARSGVVITALQSELTELTGKFNILTSAQGKNAAEAYVDDAIKMGRVGVKSLRDIYISMHMENAKRTETLIGAMPVLNSSGTSIAPPAPKAGETIALNAEELGRKAAAYQGEQMALGIEIDIVAAVHAVQGGAK